MTCRHSRGDPNCSGHPQWLAEQNRETEKVKKDLISRGWGQLPTTPDSENYEIIVFERVGEHLVLKVRYPNCSNCSYEGDKVMVFLNVEEKDVIMWKKIDPHFRNPTQTIDNKQAPSPAARFPASTKGWSDAVTFANGRSKTNFIERK